MLLQHCYLHFPRNGQTKRCDCRGGTVGNSESERCCIAIGETVANLQETALARLARPLFSNRTSCHNKPCKEGCRNRGLPKTED
eukprot:159819-Amphidinium_carterae.1